MIRILDAQQIRNCDEYTISHEPIASIDLMERAAIQLFNWITKRFEENVPMTILAGTGNNGGDALALARLMFLAGFKSIHVVVIKNSNSFSADCKTNFERLKKTGFTHMSVLHENDPLPIIDEQSVVVDGLLGSGLNRPVTGYLAALINHINKCKATVVSIDIPSGLFCNDNRGNEGVIMEADYTLSFQFPKLPFFFSENEVYTGEWHILPIWLDERFINEQQTDFYFLEKKDITQKLKVRHTFSHKGTFGHALLVAGSYQKTGAAVLSSRACMRSGVGLLTVHVPQSAYQIMQTAVPEAMLCIDESESGFCRPEIIDRFSAVGIGPGVGTKMGMRGAVKLLIETVKVPIVLDADALNILADTPDLLAILPKNTILTPHPGEFDRLTKCHQTGYDRLLTQIEFAKKHHVIVVLKGAFTSVACPDGMVYFNSTGNPGMATGGSGDVLTGIILSLLAQGYQPLDAALTGVYVHGLAGDLAKTHFGEEAMIASDIIENLGNAFIELRRMEHV